jgi:hypothetical protein
MGIREEAKRRTIVKRAGLDGREILTVKNLPDQDLYHYHWINDTGDRLQKRYDEGYDFVDKNGLAAGDTNVESARGTSSVLCKNVGGGITSYLMRIPIDLYNEYQQAKDKMVKDAEDDIKRTAARTGLTGTLELGGK